MIVYHAAKVRRFSGCTKKFQSFRMLRSNTTSSFEPCAARIENDSERFNNNNNQWPLMTQKKAFSGQLSSQRYARPPVRKAKGRRILMTTNRRSKRNGKNCWSIKGSREKNCWLIVDNCCPITPYHIPASLSVCFCYMFFVTCAVRQRGVACSPCRRFFSPPITTSVFIPFKYNSDTAPSEPSVKERD